jgi:hypothetical protein
VVTKRRTLSSPTSYKVEIHNGLKCDKGEVRRELAMQAQEGSAAASPHDILAGNTRFLVLHSSGARAQSMAKHCSGGDKRKPGE